jgi:copper chaperone CopZ
MEATMQQTKRVTVALDVRPMLRGSEKAAAEAVLGRRPGVERVEANPVSQTTTTVVFDPAQTALADLRRWVQESGLHCAGQVSSRAHLRPTPGTGPFGRPRPSPRGRRRHADATGPA